VSDDTDSNVINLPARGGDSGGMPDAPDGGDLFYSEPPDSDSGGVVPPESPEEATMELPVIRGPISPEAALRETGMPDDPDSGDEEYEEGEYVQPRSLADRLGDWLELRIEMARDRHAGEVPFREAEIARKTALLEARTAQETAMMEQNAKFHAAQMKAKADKAAARGKADADRTRASSSGMGSDKGRSKAGGGGGGSSGRGSGGGRDSGTNRSGGGAGRGSGGGNFPKGAGKGSDRSAGGRGGGSKGNESPGGPKGRQNGSGGSGSGKGSSGKGSSGGSGKNRGSGSGKGGSKGDGGKTQNTSSPRAERARSRQERAAARQAARQQRRSADQAAHLADRSKDRDQDRAHRQAAREERRAAKAERKAARKAKREAAKAADDRTTLGAAVAEEAQRRWDKRRTAAKDKPVKDKAAKDGKAPEPDTGAKDSKDTRDGRGAKDADATSKKGPTDGPEPAADGPKADSATKEPNDAKKPGGKPSGEAGKGGAKSADDKRSFKERVKDRFTKAATPPGPAPGAGSEEPPRTARPEDLGATVDSPGRSSRPPKSEPVEEDIVDAVIVDDPADPFGTYVSRPAGLPRAPEPHTQRPGTTRPTAQEDPMASEVKTTASGQTGMAAKHRTDITFGEYLMEIVNIAIAAALDKDRAQDLAVALGKVADALRDMATDLIGDHNIATEVVNQITDLADAATRMKQLAERCATECEIASEAARIAAMSVGRVYGEDIQAMDDAGLAHVSAAAHHD
jgi:hypothetical protein